MFQPLNAKVEAHNYNFSLDTLHEFLPGKKAEELEKKHGKSESMSKQRGIETKKFNVSHIRYKFPVIVQIKDGVILDFVARLPSYFLHDVFLQSLVNRMGKQKFYKKTGEEAFYTWDEGLNHHVYSGSCTITCFPVFYAVHPLIPVHTPILKQMKLGK